MFKNFKTILKRSLCVGLSALVLAPGADCFAHASPNTVIDANVNVSETDSEEIELTEEIEKKYKELEKKSGKVDLKTWIAAAATLGIGAVAAGAIFGAFRHKTRGNSGEESNADDFGQKPGGETDSVDEGSEAKDVINQLDGLFSEEPDLKTLDDPAIGKALKDSGDKRSSIQKICEHYQIGYRNLNVFLVNNRYNFSKENIQNDLRDYFLNDDHLYNPRKRFVLSCIINDLKSPDDKALYNVFFKINEEANKKVFVNALKRNGDKHTDAQKSILNLFFLAHLGNLTFNYPGGSSAVKPETEYVASMLSYGETVMVTFPWETYNAKNRILSLTFPNFYDGSSSFGWSARPSTHSGKWENGTLDEIKLTTPAAVVNTMGNHLYGSQKGININVSQPLNSQSVMGTTGHVLVGDLSQTSGLTGAFFKLEDSSPSQTSIFGHTHGPSGAGNLVSATCQLRNFSPHSERNGVKLDLSGLERDTVQDMLTKFDNYLDGSNYDDSIISTLYGPVMNQSAFKNFCVGKGIIDSNDDTDYYTFARNPQRFYENMAGMKLLDSKDNNTGLIIFCKDNTLSYQYSYFISDNVKFENYFKDAQERDRLKAHQCKLFYLESGYMSQGSDAAKTVTSIQDISRNLREYISPTTLGKAPAALLSYDIYSSAFEQQKGNPGGWINSIIAEQKKLINSHYSIPGITLYRYSGTSGTYYGYIIDHNRYADTLSYLQNTLKLSCYDIAKIIAAQNLWLYTSGNSDWTIAKLPKNFADKINSIKKYHASESYQSGLVENSQNWSTSWRIKPGSNGVQPIAKQFTDLWNQQILSALPADIQGILGYLHSRQGNISEALTKKPSAKNFTLTELWKNIPVPNRN